MSKLNLDFDLVKKARASAKVIADDIQEMIDLHTTVTVERTVLRLLGVDGVNEIDQPLPNVLVDHVKEKGGLSTGLAYWMGNAMIETKITSRNRGRRCFWCP